MPTQKSIAFPRDYILLYSQSYSFIFRNMESCYWETKLLLKNNNQCFKKIEDYFLTEIENTYIVYKRMRMSLFLIGGMQKKS